MHSIGERLFKLKENNLFRDLKETVREDGVTVIRNGKRLISFACNDYLGLSQHPKVKEAAIKAIKKYGSGAGASRFITGNYSLYKELECRLAELKITEDAIVFGSGYLANIGIIPALAGRNDLIIADKLIHASLIDGIKLSGAKFIRFPHNNIKKCGDLLKKFRSEYKNCLIITDNVFSMDGDLAPVDKLFELAEKYDSWLMTDDAHGLGILSNESSKKPHIQMGTLSKAVGCYGGYVCTSKETADYLRNKSRSLIYSTALPPAVVASAIAAIDIISSDEELVKKPLENARYFTSVIGLKDAESSIVPLILKYADKAVNASEILQENGFLVPAIRPPTVPENTSRLRFAFSSLHNSANIDTLINVLKKEGLV